MKLRARCEAENESNLSLETVQLWQSARDERGTRERERERERERGVQGLLESAVLES